ncbi:radical SAM protein [Helicobacter jaachi]|uniref:Radical SAM protein n=1 Tax=Helicobacter jaachi TaxID=1677920 RepID=A0A4U8T6C4_9HELI|nr:radical SAM protein [Helicobacter jaachi]TLD95150.1 radical SAM protein [Helicobacter jaachi]
MSDKFRIDSHKLIFHPQRVSAWQQAYGDWEKEKHIYPIYVEVSPYGGCNHRCTFCGVDYMGYKSIKIDLEVYAKRIEEMGRLGVKSVMFAGEGEPFLHKDLPQMSAISVQSGVDVGITTNFVLASEKNLPLILQSASWIKVSLNAGDKESYALIHRTKEADFEKVLANLALSVRLRKELQSTCTIGAQMLLLPQNYHTAFALAHRLKGIGVDYLVIKPYSQHLFSKTRQYEGLDYSAYLSLESQLETLNDEHFSVVFRASTMRKLQTKQPYTTCYSTPYFWGYISSNGDVYGCSCYLGQDKFAYGNINEQSFEEIWTGEKRKKSAEYVREKLDISQCRVNCRMDSVNRYLWELQHPNGHINFI